MKQNNILIGVFIGILVAFLFNKMKKNNHGNNSNNSNNNSNTQIISTGSQDKRDIINILARQAARWSVAAQQDKDPLIAVLHANYGAGYLWAVSDITSASEFKIATGKDFNKFKKEIVNIQDESNKRAVKTCPDLGPKNKYLAEIGGES